MVPFRFGLCLKGRGTFELSAPSPGDALRLKSAILLRGQNCTQRFLEGFIVRPAILNNCKWCPQACPDSRKRFFVAVNVRFRLRCILR